jgi:HK97 family phage prohead protease
MTTERKSLPFEVKAADDSLVELYAAAFSNVDRANEVIEPGAFRNLPEFVLSGWLGVNHEMDDLPVATIETAEQDTYGLKLVCRWHSTAEAQATRTVVKERMERGKEVKCSIGYRVTEDAMEQRDGESVRVLKGIEIYEASIVNLPCNPAARVTSAKSWTDAIEAAYAELATCQKEGRVLSTRSRERLKACRDKLKDCHAELDGMLTETDFAPPEMAAEVVKASPAPDAELDSLFLNYLALCAQI